MNESKLWFQFQVETDSTGTPKYGVGYSSGEAPFLIVDIYTISGERVATIEGVENEESFIGLYNKSWDMKNDAGKPVASGVYIAYARLFSSELFKVQLAEAHTKVAVIR